MLSFLSAPAIDLFMADRVVYIREKSLVSSMGEKRKRDKDGKRAQIDLCDVNSLFLL
jgi:hypothetical protein